MANYFVLCPLNRAGESISALVRVWFVQSSTGYCLSLVWSCWTQICTETHHVSKVRTSFHPNFGLLCFLACFVLLCVLPHALVAWGRRMAGCLHYAFAIVGWFDGIVPFCHQVFVCIHIQVISWFQKRRFFCRWAACQCTCRACSVVFLTQGLWLCWATGRSETLWLTCFHLLQFL